MDERERGLAFLRKHASNAPMSRVVSSKNRVLVQTIVSGIGPAIREQFDELRREIAAKDAHIKAQAARITVLESVHADIAVIRAGLGALRMEMEAADPTRRYAGAATQRRLLS